MDKINRPLSDKEKRVVDAVLSTKSKTEAAASIDVPYSGLLNILKRPHVKREISSRQDDSANRADITNEWLINEIKDIALEARSDKQFGASLKGLEMLCKIKGMFDEADNNGITYNVMGSVILAPDDDAAKRLLANPEQPIEGEYEVMNFNVGDDVKKT